MIVLQRHFSRKFFPALAAACSQVANGDTITVTLPKQNRYKYTLYMAHIAIKYPYGQALDFNKGLVQVSH